MGEAGLRQSEVAAAANSGDSDRLVDGALDSGSDRVALFPFVGRLLGPSLLDRLVNVSSAQHQLASGPDRACALWTDRAWSAGGDRKSDHDRVVAAFGTLRPDRAPRPLTTDDLTPVPVDGERGTAVTVTGPGLSGVVDPQRAEQGDVMLAAGADHQIGGGVARVHDVLAGHQAAAVEVGVDVLKHFQSVTVASVVTTFVTRCGSPVTAMSSHVSVRWIL